MHLLLFVGHLLGDSLVILTLAKVVAQALFVILLLIRKMFCFVRDIAHLGTGLERCACSSQAARIV